MMSDPRDHILERAFAEHDGEGTGAPLSNDDPALGVVGSLEMIDAALRAEYGLDGSDIPEAPAPTAAGRAGPMRFRLAIPLALAALVLLSVSAFVVLPRLTAGSLPDSPRAYYAEAIDAGFEPEVVCDTPEKFEAYALGSFGQVIRADFGAGVAMIGWRYPASPAGSPPEYGDVAPRTLLARSPGGNPVVTLFLQPGLPEPDVSVTDGLRVHRARIGSLDVYEISTLEAPVVLGLLSAE